MRLVKETFKRESALIEKYKVSHFIYVFIFIID